RCAEPVQPAVRLPLPDPVPTGQGEGDPERDLRRVKAQARGQEVRPLRRLPFCLRHKGGRPPLWGTSRLATHGVRTVAWSNGSAKLSQPCDAGEARRVLSRLREHKLSARYAS